MKKKELIEKLLRESNPEIPKTERYKIIADQANCALGYVKNIVTELKKSQKIKEKTRYTKK